MHMIRGCAGLNDNFPSLRIKQTNIETASTAIMHNDATYTAAMNKITNYKQKLSESCSLYFAEAGVVVLVK